MEDQVKNTTFVPPEGAMQFLANVDWKTNDPCEEYPIWVTRFGELCPDGKRGYVVIDPKYTSSNIGFLVCECHGKVIE